MLEVSHLAVDGCRPKIVLAALRFDAARGIHLPDPVLRIGATAKAQQVFPALLEAGW